MRGRAATRLGLALMLALAPVALGAQGNGSGRGGGGGGQDPVFKPSEHVVLLDGREGTALAADGSSSVVVVNPKRPAAHRQSKRPSPDYYLPWDGHEMAWSPRGDWLAISVTEGPPYHRYLRLVEIANLGNGLQTTARGGTSPKLVTCP